MQTIAQKMKNKSTLSIRLTSKYNIVLIKDNNNEVQVLIDNTLSMQTYYLYCYTKQQAESILFDVVISKAINTIIDMFIEYDSVK